MHILSGFMVLLTAVFMPLGGVSAFVTTDQTDYAPGSIVTISGDNSDNAGWIPGETVVIEVITPYGSESGTDVVAEDGSFSWQFTLPADESAVGDYSYTVTGLESGVTQSGVFTDNKNFEITFAGTGGGSIAFSSVVGTPAPSINPCTATCSNALNNNATGVLTVTPNVGSIFTGWSGSFVSGGSTTCTGTTSPCTLSLSNSAQALTATFDLEAAPPDETGSISGMKFEDVDGDGSLADTVNPLDGWTIELYDDGDNFITDTTTAGGGSYSFADLDPGTYKVCEVLQVGWTPTFPLTTDPNCHTSVVVVADTETPDIDFGNFELGEVHGVKFEDLDGDGEPQEAGEPELENWTIRIYKVGTPWTLVDSALTDSNGEYEFDALAPGEYKVCEVLSDGWMQTFVSTGTANGSPNASEEAPLCQTVNINASGETNTRNFGNFELGAISGYKYEDVDGDGDLSDAANALDGWEICITGGDCVTTGDGAWADGYYEFADLPIGVYEICETQQIGWVQTAPSGDECHDVTIDESGDLSTNNSFGNFELFDVSGMKFFDLDQQGDKDAGEPGLSGWTIRLYKDGGLFATTVTDADGNYLFEDLGPGSYMVCEFIGGGWTQTYPAAGGGCTELDEAANGHAFDAVSGEDRTALDFGNECFDVTGGMSMGFWSNKNGQALIDGADITELNNLNLKNDKGEDVILTNAASVKNFLTGSTSVNAKNMAFMLSGQLAATVLNVLNGKVDGSDLLYLPELLPFSAELADDGASISVLGFITVSDLIDAANEELGENPSSVSPHASRVYQEALKNALERINKNAEIVVCEVPTP